LPLEENKLYRRNKPLDTKHEHTSVPKNAQKLAKNAQKLAKNACVVDTDIQPQTRALHLTQSQLPQSEENTANEANKAKRLHPLLFN
jgi:hypothetical protein